MEANSGGNQHPVRAVALGKCTKLNIFCIPAGGFSKYSFICSESGAEYGYTLSLIHI